MKLLKLKNYIDKLRERNLLINYSDNTKDILEKEIEYMSYNSTDIKNNTMFICKGASFKKEYLYDAISNGTIIYVSEIKYDVEIPYILVNNIKLALSLLASMYYDMPSNKLNIIAITGTKGKSTTSYFVKYILDEYSKSVNEPENGIISSIYTYDGKDMYKSKLTTPESFDLQRNLYNAYSHNIKNVVMEASSQALKYGRVEDVKFDIAAFLNISEDHISPIEHNDFNDYFSSKLKIFEKAKNVCINLDMDFIDRVLKQANSLRCNINTFSIKDKNANVYASNIHKEGLYTVFDVSCNINEKISNFKVTLTIPGLFNVENALAAICITKILNIPDKYIIEGLKKAKSEGRMEIYSSKDEKILSIVDYAHNRVSFEKIFETIKEEYPNRKIIAIFGCPGNKAPIRRKDLGEVAALNSDYIYLTEDDPAYETVLGICNEISETVKLYNNNYEIIEDRTEAIKKAVEKIINSKEKYILLLLGKGNECTQKVGSGYAQYVGDSKNITDCIKAYEKNR